jgi:hypothetical protein
MECTIAFQPTHLGSYVDQLFVQPEGSLPFAVQLAGERHPPGLTLPDVLDCGPTLVGRPAVRRFAFKNTGGQGRCRFTTAVELHRALDAQARETSGIAVHTPDVSSPTSPEAELDDLPVPSPERVAQLPASFWEPAPGSQAAGEPALQLQGGVFSLAPALLDLAEGAAAELRVCYTPSQKSDASATFLAVYDNGEARIFTVQGVGDTARVSIDGLTGSVDVHGRPSLLLDGVLPGHTCRRRLLVTNHSRLRLGLAWHMTPPPDNMQWPPRAPLSADLLEGGSNGLECNRLHLSSPRLFLDAGETAEVTVTFTPGSRHPRPALAAAQLAILDVTDAFDHDQGGENGTSGGGGGGVSSAADASSSRLQVVESFLVEGRCAVFRVSAEPAAIAFGAECAVSETYTALLTLVNESAEAVTFNFLPCVISTGSVVPLPSRGSIPAHGHVRIQVRLRPRRTGEFDARLQCALQGGGLVTVPVLATLTEPPLLISPAALRLGTMRVGRSVTARLTVSNPYSTAACIGFGAQTLDGERLCEDTTSDGDARLASDACPVLVHFSPTVILLAPGEAASVTVSISPVREGTVKLALTAHGAGPSLAVATTGSVFSTHCLFAESELYFPGLFVGKVATTHAVLRNATPVSTRWSWREGVMLPFEKDTPLEAYSMAVSPARGTLAAGEAVSISVNLTPRQEKTGGGVFLLFDIEDVPRPLPLLVRASVRELFISARLLPLAANTAVLPAANETPPPKGAAMPSVDFGDLALQQTACRVLRLCNWGPVATTVFIDAAHLRTVDLVKAGADVEYALVTHVLTPQQLAPPSDRNVPARASGSSATARRSVSHSATPRELGRFASSSSLRTLMRSARVHSAVSVLRQSRGDMMSLAGTGYSSLAQRRTLTGSIVSGQAPVRLQKTSTETAAKVLHRAGTRHGAAFAPAKREIRLPGGSAVDVPIYAYVNGFGLYEDVLVIAGQGVPPLIIPLRVHAAGSPLTTSIGGRGQVTPLLRLPHCAVGARHAENSHTDDIAAHSSRPLSVHNESPLPIAVEWEPCFMPSRAPQAVDLLSRWEEDGVVSGVETGPTGARPTGSGRFRLKLTARMFEGKPDPRVFRVRHQRHIVAPGATAEVLVSFTAVEEGTFYGLLRGRVRVATEEELADHLALTGSLRATALAPRAVLNQTRAQAAEMGVRPAVTPAPRALRMWTDHAPVSKLWESTKAGLGLAPWRVTRRPDLAQLYDVRLLLSGEGVGPALQLSTDSHGLLFEVAANDLEALAEGLASLDTPSWRMSQEQQAGRSRGRRISHGGLDWTLGPHVQGGARAHRTLTLWNTTTVTQQVHAEVMPPFAVYIMAAEAKAVQKDGASGNVGTGQTGLAGVGPQTAGATQGKELLESSITRQKLLEGSLAGILGMTQPVLKASNHELQPLRGPLELLPGSAASIAIGWRPPDGAELVEHMASRHGGSQAPPPVSATRGRRRSSAMRGGLSFLTEAAKPPGAVRRSSVVLAAKKWRAQTKVSEHGPDAAFDIRAALLLRPEVGDVYEVPLKARVLLPRLQASVKRLDFDASLVGSPHVQTLVVENMGRSACNWQAHLENESDPEGRVFKCMPASGYLQASLNKISDTRVVLKVRV